MADRVSGRPDRVTQEEYKKNIHVNAHDVFFLAKYQLGNNNARKALYFADRPVTSIIPGKYTY